MNYGVPYMGSKSRIATKIMDALPEAKNFYDLFAGGGAMTHCAMLSGKYEHFIMNDINPLPTKLFIDSVKGKYRNCDRWVSRDEFFLLKDIDPFVKYCWSFGNDGRTYIYGRHIEPIKKLMHEMFFAETPKARELVWKKLMRAIMNKQPGIRNIDSLESLQSLECLQSLESLERLASLESLQRLASLERLESLERDYAGISIKPDSVVYCDIPYKGTKGYEHEFDYERFYDWACSQNAPVYISEYAMPEDHFECVLEMQSTQRLGKNGKGNKVTEKLFVPKRQ